jgi:hypothetical protein
LENPAAGAAISTMAISDQGGNGNDNGLLASIQHRFAQHYTLLSNYAYSHCINDGDTNTELGGPTYQNPANRAGDRGSCSFDVRQISNMSVVATSQVNGSGWTARLLNQWQLSPLISIHSGNVLNLTTGTDNSLNGVGLDRPNAVPGVA